MFCDISYGINPFHTISLFLDPLKAMENLDVFGGIEKDQWHEIE